MVTSGIVNPKVLCLAEELQGSMLGMEQNHRSTRWERTEEGPLSWTLTEATP